MSARTNFLIGHGGYCKFRSYSFGDTPPEYIYIPLVSGSYSRSFNVPVKGTFSTPFNGLRKERKRTGTGTLSFSGSLSLELSSEMRDIIFSVEQSFFRRDNFFDIILHDGESKLELNQCVWSSLSVSADVRSLVTAQIQFMCCNNYENDIVITGGMASGGEYTGTDSSNAEGSEGKTSGEEDSIDYPVLEPYWQYGAYGVTNFSLSFSRSVQPVYLNKVLGISKHTEYYIGPTYLRVGLLDAQLSITCWERWFDHKTIRLGNKTITFDKGVFNSSKEYNLSGIEANSVKSYNLSATGFTLTSNLMAVTEGE